MQSCSSHGRISAPLGQRGLKQLSANLSSFGGHTGKEVHTNVSARRVTIHPFHPNSKEAFSHGGKLILLPSSLEELLVVAEGKFDNNPTTVLSKNGATIDDILVVQDEDHLYIVNDQQVNSAPQGDVTEIISNLQTVINALVNMRN
jgi:hypothetical protein